MMKRTAPFLAPVLAASLAFSTLAAAPAQASETDTAKVLLGLTALTIIGAAIADNNSHAPAPQHVHRPPPPVVRPAPPVVRPYVPPRVVKRPLPAQCRQTVSVNGKKRTLYAKPCLQRSLHTISQLPRSCERTVRSHGRTLQVYYANCLREHGWPV